MTTSVPVPPIRTVTISLTSGVPIILKITVGGKQYPLQLSAVSDGKQLTFTTSLAVIVDSGGGTVINSGGSPVVP